MKDSLINLCSWVRIGEENYKINTDFKTWIEIEHLFFDKTRGSAERLAEILALAYPTLPPNPFEAVEGVIWFYSGGREHSSSSSHKNVETYDLKEDFDYIWGAFLSQFQIDLTECSLHWWKFRALLLCLSDDCRFSKIVGYRSVDLSKIKDKDQKKFYQRMKKKFRLSGYSQEESMEEQLVDGLNGFF